MRARRAYTAGDILTAGEVRQVIAAVYARAKRRPVHWPALVVFELATCAGLRASEIAGLRVGDVHLDIQRPYLFVRPEIAKGSRWSKRARGRKVALDWAPLLVAHLVEWMQVRRDRAAAAGTVVQDDDRFVVSLHANAKTAKVDRIQVWRLWRYACRGIITDPGRLGTHTGRHTFASNALACGFDLAQVSAALGHANVTVTSRYLHPTDDAGKRGRLFGELGADSE